MNLYPNGRLSKLSEMDPGEVGICCGPYDDQRLAISFNPPSEKAQDENGKHIIMIGKSSDGFLLYQAHTSYHDISLVRILPTDATFNINEDSRHIETFMNSQRNGAIFLGSQGELWLYHREAGMWYDVVSFSVTTKSQFRGGQALGYTSWRLSSERGTSLLTWWENPE